MNSIIEKYLTAWDTHDVRLVRELFDPDAVYNISGKKRLNGIDEICGYWERNKRRQHNLRVLPPLELSDGTASSSFMFCARFVDTEEKEDQTVYGHIHIEVRNDKVMQLSESYLLERRPQEVTNPSVVEEITNPITDFFRSGYWQVKNAAKIFLEYLITRSASVLVTLMAILLSFSAFNLNDLPDWLLRLWALSLQFSPLTSEVRASLVTRAYHNISTLASIFVFLVIIIGWLRLQIRLPISITNLQAPGHDLSVMRRRFKYARHLIIFAGDFDFIGRDEKLRHIFRQLHARNNLILISNKTETEVRLGFGNHPDAVYLFEDLKRHHHIFFSHKEEIRCSIVRGWLGSEIIYRYDGGSADSLNNQHICIMKGRREARPVMELVEKLLKPTLARPI